MSVAQEKNVKQYGISSNQISPGKPEEIRDLQTQKWRIKASQTLGLCL
jgi:hypothetical protein